MNRLPLFVLCLALTLYLAPLAHPAAAQAPGEWAWVGGSKQADEPGSYGTEYQFASANIPGGREQGASWIDQKGRFWLFGGLGPDSAGATGYLNDLWVFDPAQGAHGEWAWMGGSDTVHVASGHFNYSANRVSTGRSTNSLPPISPEGVRVRSPGSIQMAGSGSLAAMVWDQSKKTGDIWMTCGSSIQIRGRMASGPGLAEVEIRTTTGSMEPRFISQSTGKCRPWHRQDTPRPLPFRRQQR
jgi:hypothetical protein